MNTQHTGFLCKRPLLGAVLLAGLMVGLQAGAAPVHPPRLTPTPHPGGGLAHRYGPGVAGHLTLSPAMPVCQVGVPCDKPYADAIVLILSPAQEQIGSARTNAQGAYIVSVPPGDYIVQIKTGFLPRCPELNVTVGKNQFAMADIVCDTGVR